MDDFLTIDFALVFKTPVELLNAAILHENMATDSIPARQFPPKLEHGVVGWDMSAKPIANDEVHVQFRIKHTSDSIDYQPAVTLYGVISEELSAQRDFTLPNNSESFTIILSNFDAQAGKYSVTIYAGELSNRISAKKMIYNKMFQNRMPTGMSAISFVSGIINPLVFSKVENYAETAAALTLEEPAPATTHFPLWFATTRQPTIDADTQEVTGFSSELATQTFFGKCYVDIPKSHVIGQLKPSLWRWLIRLITKEENEKPISLVNSLLLEEPDYWLDMQAAAAKWKADVRCAVVFIHGYNTSFEQAALRTAQMGEDLGICGPVSFFSWPSKAARLAYAADGAAIEGSEHAFADYLQSFAQKSGADVVHIIAHSMGNRGLLRALQHISIPAKKAKLFGQLILAAPDVDQTLFLNSASKYVALSQRTTLYASDKDRALAASSILRYDSPRAGLTPPLTIAPGIDTIHVSNIDVTTIGHSYVAEARDVLADISLLIRHNHPPADRVFLRAVDDAGSQYWEFKE